MMRIVQFKNYKFVITETPTDKLMNTFVSFFKFNKVTDIVRLSEPAYSNTEFNNCGMVVHDLFFADGSCPSPKIIEEWLAIVKSVFSDTTERTIAVHCVSGLGRSPLLVTIALIELCGMENADAITYVRNTIKGALNRKQLDFVYYYKKSDDKCIIL